MRDKKFDWWLYLVAFFLAVTISWYLHRRYVLMTKCNNGDIFACMVIHKKPIAIPTE